MEKLKKHKLWKKLLLIITSAVMLLSALPMQIFTQVSAATYKVQLYDASDGYGLKSNVTICKNGTLYAGGRWVVITQGGEIAYCLQPEKSMSNPNNDLNYSKGTVPLTESQRKMLGRIFLYSYTQTPDNFYDYDSYVPQYLATQLLTWEVIVGQRDANFNRISNGYTLVVDIIGLYNNSAVSNNVRSYYEAYEKNIKADKKDITFSWGDTNTAKLKAVTSKSDGTYTFTDANAQLNNFDVTVTDGSVVSKSATQLKIKANPNKTAIVKISQNNVNASGERRGILVLTNGSNYQGIGKAQADPREAYAAVKGVEEGSLRLRKFSDDGKIEGIKFHIKGGNIDGNYKTDSKGYINIEKLVPGTYTITEETSFIYNNIRSKNVIVEAGKIATVSFTNTVKSGTIVVYKNSEDGQKGNFKFSLHSELASSGKVYKTYDDRITTSGSGMASWGQLPFYDSSGNELIYVISEKDTPDRYVKLKEWANYLGSNINDDDVGVLHINFENKLKRSDVLIVKKDYETGAAIPLPGTEFQILDSKKIL